MPHKGESASFFSLRFYCDIQAGIPLPPPFLPPFSPVPSPIATPGELGRRSFHAGAQTLYFQRKPPSEGDGRRAGAGAARGSGPAAGAPPAPAPARAEPAEASRLRARQPPRLAAPSSPNAPGRQETRKRLRGAPGPGTAAGTAHRRLLCPARGPRERAGSGRTEGAPRKPARRAAPPPPRPPALRLCAAFGLGTEVRWHSSAEGHRARHPLERSQSARQPRAGGGEGERAARAGKEAARPGGGARAPREPRAEPRIVSFHRALGRWPPT